MLGRINRILIIALLTTLVFPVLLGLFLRFRGLSIDDDRIFYAAFGSAFGALIWSALNVKSEPNLTRIALWIVIVVLLISAVPVVR